MSNQKLRFCLFGAGEMASIHAHNLARDNLFDLVAIVDPSIETATALASICNSAVIGADDAFHFHDFDAYVIASPPKTHIEYLERAIKTPSYIFCEKPIDHDFERSLACYRQIKGNENRVQMGFNRRFDPSFAALRERLVEGEIGKIEQLIITSRDPQAPTPEGFNKSSGMLKETTVHDFDLVRWLLNDDPNQIYVMADALINPEFKKINQVDTATTVIQMNSGTQVTIINSLRAIFGYDQRIEALGSTGQLQVGNLAQSLVIKSNADGVISEKPLWNYPQRYADAYYLEMANFIDNVRNQRACKPNLYDGLCASQMSEAALLSHAEGIPVKLEKLN